MLIAFTAMENSLESMIDPRFGRAAYYVIVNTDTDEITIHDNSTGINASNGAGTGAAQTLSEYGVKELYTGRVGPKAADVLNTAGIIYHENITGTVQEVLSRIKAGNFTTTTTTVEPSTVSPAEGTGITGNSTCPGALPGGGGYRMSQGRGLGRGRGAGRGQGAGRGRGMCR